MSEEAHRPASSPLCCEMKISSPSPPGLPLPFDDTIPCMRIMAIFFPLYVCRERAQGAHSTFKPRAAGRSEACRVWEHSDVDDSRRRREIFGQLLDVVLEVPVTQAPCHVVQDRKRDVVQALEKLLVLRRAPSPAVSPSTLSLRRTLWQRRGGPRAPQARRPPRHRASRRSYHRSL